MPDVDIINYNQPMQSLNKPVNETPLKKEESLDSCFNGDDWSTNAADAIGEAFNNMDDFLIMYKESQN